MTTSFALLGSTTLGSNGNTISISGLTAKKYLIVEFFGIATGGLINALMRFNGDTGSNYNNRYSLDGGADGTQTSQNNIQINNNGLQQNVFARIFIINISSQEKLIICHLIQDGGTGAANAPHRQEVVGKWTNTSNQITQIDIVNSNTGNFATGSILSVYGSD